MKWLVLLFSSVALAQPMMVDPSKMSGIPRPDPNVPAGTITVRLIRGELSNRVTNHEVVLEGPSGKKTEKTNEEGRATFTGLSGGPWIARARDGETELASQEMNLPPAVGVRVMLVFPAGELGYPDGKGYPDKKLPGGTIVVKAQDGEGKPLAGVEIVLGQARAGESAVKEHKARSDANGEARFEGLDAKPTSGYLAEVRKEGTRFSGKPFRLSENMGARVVIEVRPVSKDVKLLTIGQGSHLIFDVQDDSVQVVEVLRLNNAGTQAVEIEGGLHLPLPEKAVSVTVGPQSPPSFSASGHEAVWRGPLPPGDTELQVMFVMAYEGDHLEFRQATPVPFAAVDVVTEKIDGMSVSGHEMEREDRDIQGRKLVLYRGKGTSPGGDVVLELEGLPHQNGTWRYLTAVVTVALLLFFGFYAIGAPSSQANAGQLEQLEKRREHLLDELAALDAKGDDKDGKRGKKREELAEKLARLYKEIDEVQL